MPSRQALVWVVSLWGCLACGDTSRETAAEAQDDSEQSDEVPPEECEVPSEPAALLPYLQRGDYKAFEHESGAHASTGPHGGRVLTYVNDLLAASLAAGKAAHPRCSASIKELFLGNDEVSGWAVLVKTDDTSKGGRGFYWLETTSTRAGRAADYQGQGVGLCVACHSEGHDFFRTRWPLQ